MSKGLRVALYGAGAVLLVFLLGFGSVTALSNRDFNRTYDLTLPAFEIPDMDHTELVALGEHVATIRGCLECHTEDAGGGEFADDPAMGLLWASNLTNGEGGVAAYYGDEDWDRAIRHGVGPEGTPLLFMPSHEFWPISDGDLAALVAFFRNAPPVDRAIPEPAIGPLARVLYLTGQLPLVPASLVDHTAERPQAPPAGPTADYGEYLATGCTGCHGAGFSGGRIAGAPPDFLPAKNITPQMETGIGSWSQEDFVRLMREGVRPDGSEVNAEYMPIRATSHMTDTELHAVYAFLMELEPRMYGNR